MSQRAQGCRILFLGHRARVTLNRFATAAGAFILALSLAASARATLWVSPSGDDHNPGTEERPLRTIERARDVVRTLNRDMADDLTVFIGGEFHLGRPIVFGQEDSGSNGFNIIYTAAPGEHPVITGGVRITGWAPAGIGSGLWSAPSPDGLEGSPTLFVNGTPACRTRSRLLEVFAKESGEAPATDPKTQWKNPDDVIFKRAGRDAIWSERSATTPTIVENAFELLGRPGEWYFDRPARRIYYTPRPGEKMAEADSEAAVAHALISGSGSKEKPITGLIFKGIRFEFTAVSEAPGDGPATVGPADAPAGVRFYNAAGVQFLEDDFLHMGTPALVLGPAVDGGTVEGCLFGDISWSAVQLLDASGVRISESRLSYTAVDHIREGAIDVDRCAEIAIDHDQFDHFPSAAVLALEVRPGGVRRASNWITSPMISLGGFTARGPASIPAQEIGISEDYRALEDEQVSSTTIPQPPENVSAEAEDEFAYVTWIPNCRDGNSPVDTYVVESSAGAKATVTAAAFQHTGYVVMADLADGHPVSFTVSAVNALGTSPPSVPTANVTPKQKRRLRVPPAPAGLSFSAGATGSTVQITPSPGDGGSPVVSYAVSAGRDTEPIVIEGLDVVHSDALHPISRILPGFVPGHGSTVSVAAVNAAGDGKPAVIVLK
jgi:hypothetical protein